MSCHPGGGRDLGSVLLNLLLYNTPLVEGVNILMLPKYKTFWTMNWLSDKLTGMKEIFRMWFMVFYCNKRQKYLASLHQRMGDPSIEDIKKTHGQNFANQVEELSRNEKTLISNAVLGVNGLYNNSSKLK